MTVYRNGADVRAACRAGTLTSPTPGLAPGYVQANLVVLPKDWAYDFLLFCVRNPKPCPLLDVTEAGSPVPTGVAQEADLRTDLPKYRVWRHGELVEEPTDIGRYWSDDMVAFLIGCSFTFESALLAAGLPVRHIEEGRNVPMYRTFLDCRPAGRCHGKLVVSMRPMTKSQAEVATEICSGFDAAHGTPVQVGCPEKLGIVNVGRPDYGEPVTLKEGEVPVYWACGVTPQAMLAAVRPKFAITHAPGHMFVTDWRDGNLRK